MINLSQICSTCSEYTLPSLFCKNLIEKRVTVFVMNLGRLIQIFVKSIY